MSMFFDQICQTTMHMQAWDAVNPSFYRHKKFAKSVTAQSPCLYRWLRGAS